MKKIKDQPSYYDSQNDLTFEEMKKFVKKLSFSFQHVNVIYFFSLRGSGLGAPERAAIHMSSLDLDVDLIVKAYYQHEKKSFGNYARLLTR